MSSVPEESARSEKIRHDFDCRARANQKQLRANLRRSYDFIVCGAGSSGSVVARRLAENPNTTVLLLEAVRPLGIPTFADQNGTMMEGAGGAAIANLRIRRGQRLSVFRDYTYPVMDQPNLTVLTDTLVTRVIFDGRRAVSVEVVLDGNTRRFAAGCEAILSLGAIQTPKILMQSGVGDEKELGRFGIPVVQHLAGVGRNLQEHALLAGCVWQYKHPLSPRNNACEATLFWKSDPSLETPDMQILQAEIGLLGPEAASRLDSPQAGGSWSLLPSVIRPQSRGRLRLTGARSSDPLDIDTGILAEPIDLKAMLACVALCREIENSAALSHFVEREVMPGPLRGAALESFVRDAIVPHWHQTCTAKMGQDPMAVVDSRLRVHGIERLRIADGSVLSRVPTGNSMASCVIIGERAAAMIREAHDV